MDKEKTIEEAGEYIKELLGSDTTGHDFFHSERVYKTSLKIAKSEGGDSFVIGLAAWLHDADDVKLFSESSDLEHARQFMTKHEVGSNIQERVCKIIHEISFKGTDSVKPSSLEGKIVQDADRLEAIGAIGIARAFAYGGKTGRKIYDPAEKPLLNMDEKTYRAHFDTSINHFYEKLLNLKDMMNTKTGKKLAESRHKFMENYLDEFFAEWNGTK